jgi:hypothetical protein
MSSKAVCLALIAMLTLATAASAASDRQLLQNTPGRDARSTIASQNTQKVIRQAVRQNDQGRTQQVAQGGTQQARTASRSSGAIPAVVPTQG